MKNSKRNNNNKKTETKTIKNIKQQNRQKYQSSHSLPVHFVPFPSNPERHVQKKDP